MKVLLINGSPHEKRCTYTALAEAAQALEAEGVETEIAWIGTKAVHGCIACNVCSERGNNRCVFDDDVVNDLLEKAERADGYLVGTPVYYAGANGALLAILDRMFYAGGSVMQFKPAAGIASARRAGTTPAIDQINKYFQISNMPVVPSTYWPMVHGRSAEDVLQDEEGLQTMRMLGRNLAWMLRSFDRDAAAGGGHPTAEPKIMTNFIRPTA